MTIIIFYYLPTRLFLLQSSLLLHFQRGRYSLTLVLHHHLPHLFFPHHHYLDRGQLDRVGGRGFWRLCVGVASGVGGHHDLPAAGHEKGVEVGGPDGSWRGHLLHQLQLLILLLQIGWINRELKNLYILHAHGVSFNILLPNSYFDLIKAFKIFNGNKENILYAEEIN